MQLRLSKLIVREDTLPETVHSVAGVDVAYTKKTSVGAVVVLDFPSLKSLESRVACVDTRFPYISTLLSYREIPPALSAIRKLGTHPDVFLVDAHGIMHPRHLGFAAYLGLVIDRPTIGVEKSPIYGTAEPNSEQGWTPITDRGEVIGKNITEIVPDIKESGRYEKHLEVIRTGKPFEIEDFVPHPIFGDLHFILKSFKLFTLI